MEEATINKSISAVTFGFLNEQEIKALSVKKISKPVSYDNLGLPQEGGLYDRSLGVTERKERSVLALHVCAVDCSLSHAAVQPMAWIPPSSYIFVF
jgi:hypothetical protein